MHVFIAGALHLVEIHRRCVPPLKIRLREEETAYRCKQCNYLTHLKAFMKKFNDELVELGWIIENKQSRWSCPALPIKKPGKEEYRQTCNNRPVNAQTEPIAGWYADSAVNH